MSTFLRNEGDLRAHLERSGEKPGPGPSIACELLPGLPGTVLIIWPTAAGTVDLIVPFPIPISALGHARLFEAVARLRSDGLALHADHLEYRASLSIDAGITTESVDDAIAICRAGARKLYFELASIASGQPPITANASTSIR